MPLTATEQAKASRYLGYANWESLASSFQLGYPSGSQPQFLVRDAFERISDEGIELVRRDIRELECIEAQIGDTNRLKAEKLGDLRTNPNEFADLKQRWGHWQGMLSQDLGAPINPFSAATTMGGGGRNAVVSR